MIDRYSRAKLSITRTENSFSLSLSHFKKCFLPLLLQIYVCRYFVFEPHATRLDSYIVSLPRLKTIHT